MLGGPIEIRLRHARLHDDAAALFRALDLRDVSQIVVSFGRFVGDLENYLDVDSSQAYRSLLRHSSEFVRRLTERMLADRAAFPVDAAAAIARWRTVEPKYLLSEAFRDDLETIVSELLKHIRIEERLLAALAHVA
jgi:hypothetical protein